MCRSSRVFTSVLAWTLFLILATRVFGQQANVVTVENEHLAVTFNLSSGITLLSIQDKVTGHQFLPTPTSLFELALDNGPPVQSDRLSVLSHSLSPDRSRLEMEAVTEAPFFFSLLVEAPAGEPAVILHLQVRNQSRLDTFLRLVFPKIRGLFPPGDSSRWMATIPQEIGSTVPLSSGVTIGMSFNIDVGLPTAMNTMEVASLYDADGGGGIFIADVEGDVDTGIPPIQFNLSAQEAVGFWIANLLSGATAVLPGLAIGVIHSGDWHAAVDYYVEKHKASMNFPPIPSWFRDAGAIYSFGGGGAGGIYLSLPLTNLPNGALWTTFQVNDSKWNDTIPITPADVALPGGHLAAVARNLNQEDVFLVGKEGALWTIFEVGGGGWSPPIQLTKAGFAPPGAPVSAIVRNPGQEDVFLVGADGALWTLFEVNDGAWSSPIALTAAGFAPPGASVVGVRRNDRQEDVFLVGFDGTLWTLFEVNDGAWSSPLALTAPGFASPGIPVAAVVRNDHQEDVFVVCDDGAVWSLFEVDDGPWSEPLRLTEEGFAPPGANLAAVARNDHQEDVFLIGPTGAIRSTFEVNDSAWFEVDLTGPDVAPPGAPLAAVVRNSTQEDLFYVGNDGALWTLFEVNDSAWSAPVLLSIGGFAPKGAEIAATMRDSAQEDLFVIGKGRLRSFRELPLLLYEAQEMGTNIVYLWDYWERAATGTDIPYANKGDYVPRSDLGGEAALIEGIQALHEQGGKIIVYIEPFIIYKQSQIGLERGEDWAGLDVFENPYAHYAGNYTMVAPFVQWQDFVAQTAARFVGQYGVDGIFLDSWDWQLNWPMSNRAEGVLYTPQEFTRGAVTLIDKVLAAVQEVSGDREPVVVGETTSGPAGRHWHGGLSADFAFQRAFNDGKILASPARYGLPQLNYMSNGVDLNELHQIYAAGHNLALCCNWEGTYLHDNREHIRSLVEIRQRYNDALIHGPQLYQPATGNPIVAAYLYQGTGSRQIITLVNASEGNDYAGSLILRESEADSVWRDLLSLGEVFSTEDRIHLPVTVSARGLRVLHRELPIEKGDFQRGNIKSFR